MNHQTRTFIYRSFPCSRSTRGLLLGTWIMWALVCATLVSGQQDSGLAAATNADASGPNILFIAMDDLNDWIGCLGGHPQAKTPNLDRLAASGVLFTNAHCPAPACNPSRGSIFSGRAPNRSGLYDNRQVMREIMPTEVLLPKYFQNHGYQALGSGKLLHYFIDADSWDDYFPDKSKENPLPRTYYPQQRPVSLPRGGPWQYVETDWGPMPVDGEAFGGDWLVSNWVGQQLRKKHAKPFFLGCGLYRPHEPWFVPEKYFKQFPLDQIQLPPGYRPDDLNDIPAEGQRRGRNRYFAHIQKHDQWKQGIQGYLASISFADAMLGRVLDALEQGPNRDNTIVVLWSDHGWHLGEKQHWQKYTGWRACTRVPLMVRVPPGISESLPAGTLTGTRCDQPVSLVSLFSTLTDLTGLPTNPVADGPSLVPLMANAETTWDHVAVTFLNQPEAYSVSSKRFRYIHYPGGGEELYDVAEDPHEWRNLAGDPDHATILNRMRQSSPQEFAPKKMASVASLGKLAFQRTSDGSIPPSRPDGDPFQIHFINRQQADVDIFWVDRSGQPKSYGKLAPNKTRAQQTRPGAVWLIRDSNSGQQLGYFRVGDRSARAIIDRKKPRD